MKKKTLNKIKKNLSLIRHSEFLDAQEITATNMFDDLMNRMVDDCMKKLRAEKLIKSDKPKDPTQLPSDWIHLSPKLNLDIHKKLTPIIDKYLLALKYSLLGSAAGEDAIEAVRELQLFRLLPKGLIVQAFMHSSDSQKDYLSEALAVERPKASYDFLDLSLKFITASSGRFVDKTIYDLKAKTLGALDNLLLDNNFENSMKVAKEAHKLSKEMEYIDEKRRAVKHVVKELAEKKISYGQAKQVLRDATRDFSNNFDLIVRNETSMASNVAAVQTILSVTGSKDSDPIVAIVDMNDSRVSKECQNWSRHANNELKYVRLSSLAAPGSNLSKKKSAWQNSIAPRHHGCRCFLTYVPKGYKLDQFGSLVKLGPDEVLQIED